jgi:hypothetical protein
MPYLPPNYPWNMDYANIQTHPYYPSNNYYYTPNSDYLGQDEIKCANQGTRPSEFNDP